jgi:RNA polymerase sigma-70 factor (ECF subfamily)
MEGSEEAFIEMLELYQGRIYSVVHRIVVNTAECEDVVQEVFLKVLRNIRSFNFKSSLYTWLYRIAVNAAVDARKKHGPQRMMSIYGEDGKAHEIQAEVESPDQDPERREMAGKLHGAIEELSDDHRTILILREFEGLSYNEIAKALNCSKGTVESRLFRARGRLREKMERYL